jgi:hypothetical protein
MSIPSENHPAWSQLITGELEIKSTKVAVNMLIHNSRVKYKDDPSPANLVTLAKHIHGVFTKYGAVYSAELHQIFT